MKRIIVLVRHGQSEFNFRNLYTGRRDPELTAQGVEEARAAGRKLGESGYRFDIAFTSEFRRAQHTLELILSELGRKQPIGLAKSIFGLGAGLSTLLRPKEKV